MAVFHRGAQHQPLRFKMGLIWGSKFDYRASSRSWPPATSRCDHINHNAPELPSLPCLMSLTLFCSHLNRNPHLRRSFQGTQLLSPGQGSSFRRWSQLPLSPHSSFAQTSPSERCIYDYFVCLFLHSHQLYYSASSVHGTLYYIFLLRIWAFLSALREYILHEGIGYLCLV